jgi:hypothetical protein
MKCLNLLLQNKTITLLAIVTLINLTSCKKDEIKSPPIASLTLVNAISGGTSVKLGSNILSIGVNNYQQFGLTAGEHELYVWPLGDSTHPYFTYDKFSVEQGEVYSLFLGGTP